ncbi:MAG TPA: HAD-IA family hydrolase, partial [Trebonia sp.]|nr:HAD-IA family hydrolase [Trebonia sp.]
HECGLSKPGPRAYALVCARLAVEPAETVFVDDTEICVEGARRAGLHAVLYSGNAQVISDIGALAVGGRAAVGVEPGTIR